MSDPCTRAASQYASGDIKRALSNIERCQKDLKNKIKKYSNHPDAFGQLQLSLARAYRFEGQIYFGEQNIGKAHRAFSSALKAIKKATRTDDTIGLRGQIRYSLAIIALMREQYEVAEDLLLTARDDFFEANKGEQGLEVLLRLGSIKKDLNQHEEALNYYQKVQKNRKKANDKKNRRIYNGRAKLEEGKLLHTLNDGKPEKLFKKAKKLFSKAKFPKGEAQALIELSKIHQSDPDKSRDFLLEARDLGKIAESQEIQGIVLTQLGVLSLKTGNFEEGKEQLLEGLKYRSEAGDTVGTAQTLVELSRITLITSRNESDLNNAKKFADQALDLYTQINNSYGRATTLELLGSIQTKLGNIDTAKSQVQTAKSLFDDHGDISGEARMLTQLGIIYGSEDRPEKAITVLEKAVEHFENLQNPQGLAEALHILGLQIKELNQEQAIEYLKRSRNLYEQLIGDNEDMNVVLDNIDQTINSIQSQ